MTYQEAVTQLQEMMGSDMVSFESNQQLNGFERYEFLVLKSDNTRVMIHIGADGVVEKGVV